MREIKFRGKRVDGCNNWVHGSLVTDGDEAFIISSYRLLYNNVLEPVFHEVLPETVGQFTGLKDKNGKEIYEGDIVRAANNQITSIVFGEYCNDGCQAQDDERGKCNGIGFYFKHKNGYCFFGSASEGSMGYKVLGNIYENPELLTDAS